jgi:hypothetical protein
MRTDPLGPFETRADAMDHPAVRAIRDQRHQAGRRRRGAELNHQMLCSALGDAGVELGEWEHGLILRGILADEPHVVAVLAGWVTRAYQAGKQAAAKEPGDG